LRKYELIFRDLPFDKLLLRMNQFGLKYFDEEKRDPQMVEVKVLEHYNSELDPEIKYHTT